MRTTIIILLLILLQGCKSESPVSPKNKIEYNEKEYKIVFVSDRDSDGQIHIELGTKSEVYTMDINGINQTRITKNNTWDFNPIYSPDGNKIAYTAATDWLMSDINIMNNDGTYIISLGAGKNPKFSNDNSKVLFQTFGLIGIINIDGSNKKTLTNWADNFHYTLGQDFPAQLSSDDQKILFISNRNNNYDIYTMSVDGNNVKRLTNSSSFDGSCSFSPDNSKILYVSYKSGKGQIFIMESDGSNKQQLTNTSEYNIKPSFSPSGQEIVFISNRDNNTEVYTMNVDGTNQKRLTNNITMKDNPKFSPDGLNIVYEQRPDIFIIKLKSGEKMNLTNGTGHNYHPSFSPKL